MAKFKVGDRVEMVKRDGTDFKNPGVVNRVDSNTYGDFLDATDSAGRTFYGADESRFTAYVEPKPSFNVGDKVEVIKAPNGDICAGTVGVVLGLKDRNCSILVQFAGRSDLHSGSGESVNSDCWWFSVENLKLVETKPEFLKVGQRVRIVGGVWHKIGGIGEIVLVDKQTSDENELVYGVSVGKKTLWRARKDVEPINDTPKAEKSDKHWIISKLNGGVPLSSPHPFKHLSESDAVIEAQRLATANPGVKFVMYAARYEAFVELPKPVEPDLKLRWL